MLGVKKLDGTIRQICIKAGVEKFGPHRLRHTFATGMLASGATLQEVQGLLRHAHLECSRKSGGMDSCREFVDIPIS